MEERGQLGAVASILLIFIALISIVILWNVAKIAPSTSITSHSQGNFMIIVLSDTQIYSEYYPDIFTNQTQWVANNKDRLNIKFVIHAGDIVNTWDDLTQWDSANSSMSILDETGIPYSVVPGNHDHQDYDTDGSTGYYNNYFPASRFSDKSWWGGNYSENDNNYQLMTIGEDDYILLNLDYCPSDDEIRWANDTLTTYSNRKAILTTHGYLDGDADRDVHVCGDTSYIWDDLIKHHENLQIVLCGHEHYESRRTDNNLAGKPVYQILADYQDLDNGGNGWLRTLEFVPAEDKIYVRTYSPYLDRYDTDSDSQFSLDYGG